jgi:hypothetical protein
VIQWLVGDLLTFARSLQDSARRRIQVMAWDRRLSVCAHHTGAECAAERMCTLHSERFRETFLVERIN